MHDEVESNCKHENYMLLNGGIKFEIFSYCISDVLVKLFQYITIIL